MFCNKLSGIFQKIVRGIRNEIAFLRNSHFAVPTKPVSSLPANHDILQIDSQTLNLLVKLSLVQFNEAEAIQELERAVNFAQCIKEVDTNSAEPMYTLLENVFVKLRDDVSQATNADDILINAAKTVEGYFIAPPGNIPLDQSDGQ